MIIKMLIHSFCQLQLSLFNEFAELESDKKIISTKWQVSFEEKKMNELHRFVAKVIIPMMTEQPNNIGYDRTSIHFVCTAKWLCNLCVKPNNRWWRLRMQIFYRLRSRVLFFFQFVTTRSTGYKWVRRRENEKYDFQTNRIGFSEVQ